MSEDMKESFKALDEMRRLMRSELGRACSGCQLKFPRANPKILMPGQKCFCGYIDGRDVDVEEREFCRGHQSI